MLANTDRQRSTDLTDGKHAVKKQPDTSNFSNPVADKEGISDADTTSNPVAGAELPRAVWDLLQLTLGGPGPPWAAKVWVWHFLALAGLWSTAYSGWHMYSSVDEALSHVATPWFVLCIISGLGWGRSARVRWVSYWALRDHSTGKVTSRHGQLCDLLQQQDRFTPNQITAILRYAWIVRVLIMIMCAACWLIFTILTIFLRRDIMLPLDVLVAICMSYVGWPSSLAGLFGGILLDYVVRMAIVSRVQPIIDRIRSSSPASIDFDELLVDIVTVQGLVSTVSTKLEQAIVMQILGLASAAFACILVGLGPHPSDPDLWWRRYGLSHFVLFFGIAWIISSIALLLHATKISSICDDLGDALNEMTEAQVHGAVTPRMPTKEQHYKIEHLLQYVRGLNRGRGMGFVIYRKRISSSFAISLAAKVVSVMSISFPVILSLTRVEQQEGEILNNTEQCIGS